MSLTKIRKCLNIVKENAAGLWWCEEEISDLLIVISEHILALGQEHQEDIAPDNIKIIPTGLIRVKEFVKKYKVFSPTTVYKKCNHDPDFTSHCAFKAGSQWYVHPERAYEYLKNMPVFKKRLERLSDN